MMVVAEQETSSDNNTPEDIVEVLKTWDRRVVIRQTNVVKSELAQNELLTLPNGLVIHPYWPQERLRNEAATLKFVAANTTVPAPDCRLYTKMDCYISRRLALRMEYSS